MSQKLYLMKNSLGLYKIGISSNPKRRQRELTNSSGVGVDLLHVWETSGEAFDVEQRLHKYFKDQREHGEWFKDLSVEDIEKVARDDVCAIQEEIKSKNKKPLLIKIKNIGPRKKPICEIILEDDLRHSMSCPVKSVEHSNEVKVYQRDLVSTILTLHKNRGNHKKWCDSLVCKDKIYQSNCMGYVPVRLYGNILNPVFTDQLHSSISFPWANTLESVKALKEVMRQEWIQNIEDIGKDFDMSIDTKF